MRTAIVGANVAGPKGSLDGAHQSYTISANDQITAASVYRDIVVAFRNGAPVKISDLADVIDGLENTKVGASYRGKPAIVIDVQRQPGANVIETVQRVRAELPRLRRAMPAGADLTIVNDRTTTIRASIHDVQFTLVLSIALVVLVVLIFLRTIRATIIAGVALPLSLIATFGVMWFCGFSLDNLSLMFPAQDLRVGGRQSDAQYQFTLWSADIDELQKWVPRVVDRVKRVPGIVDVTTDREQGGLQANIVIDREAAARFGVRVQDIDNALNNAFSQRQISTIYGPRNQYRVILEVDAAYQRDPTDLAHIYVPGNGNAQVPLSVVTKYERGIAPLVVNHQGQFPSVTITYNLAPNALIDDVTRSLEQAVAEMHIPDVIRADFSGDIQAYKQAVGAQPLLLLAALIAVYIVLGVLYESLAHPLTIISTLPSAGLGALLALEISGTELSVIAFIGIILLIGIVKKNGIMRSRR